MFTSHLVLGLVLKYSSSYVKFKVSMEDFTQDEKNYHGNYTNSNLKIVCVYMCACVGVCMHVCNG